MIVGGKKVIVREVQQDIYQRLRGDGYSDALARVYAGRGALPSSYLEKSILRKEGLQQALQAGEMLASHIMRGNVIALSIDFDNDGQTAGAIVARAIRAFGGTINVYCPCRETEGYGTNKRIVHQAKDDGCSVLLTCDNGIVAFDAVIEAKRLGMDVVITDHHLPDNSFKLPNADYIVNPWAERGESQFEGKNLCGAGVAWYVMACVKESLDRQGWKHTFTMKSVVDLLACGTIGDMVKLDKLNLQLIRLGLEKLNSDDMNPGLQAILAVSGKSGAPVNSQTIGFTLAPMINSSSRLGSAERATKLLVTEDKAEAWQLATELREVNNERKELQKQMSELAMDSLAMDVGTHSACIFNPEFKVGIVGLVASKVKDMTNLPSGVFTRTGGGRLKGSMRSIPGVHIRDVLDLVKRKRPDIGLVGGGHQGAAGASVDEDKWDVFKSTFNEAVIELADSEAFNPTLVVDGSLSEADISMSMAEEISSEIWGQGIPAPIFSGEIQITDQKILNGAHCKFTGKIGRLMVQGIFFGRAHLLPPISNLVYSLDINVWNGNKSIQLLVQGIDESQEGLFA